MNIVTLLEMAAEAFPERRAVTCEGQSLDFSALLACARAAADELSDRKARFTGYLALASPTAPVALFASAIAGAPYVPLNYRLTKEEIDALAARIAPAVLVADPDYVARLTAPDGIAVVDRRALLARARAATPVEREPSEEPIAVQLFTSGTTGPPKAAILRHENLFSYIVDSLEFGSAEQDEAALVSVPPYHVAGISAILSSVYLGRRMVQLPSFDATAWLKLCREEGVTHAFLVPTMLGRIVEHLDSAGETVAAPKLRAIAYGGGRMPLAVIERAMKLFPGVDFTNAYGLTETSSTICLLGPDDHHAAAASEDPQVRRRLASVGLPLPAVEIEVRDEAGRRVEAEVVGRVHVRGAQVSGEYGGVGALVDAQGWFDTRDRGYLDAGGYLFLDGRADDVIVRGGENISPGEIEDVLLAHRGVRDVAVVGVPDEAWGEVVGAAIVPDGAPVDVADLQAWVRDRLRSSRAPHAVRFVDELPYNELGKLLRRVVRAEFSGG